MRPRQVFRVARRHVLDLLRDKRTLASLLLVPILTVVIMTFAQEELVGSISGASDLHHTVAVQGADNGGSFIDDLRAFGNVTVIEVADAKRAVRDGDAPVGLIIPRNFVPGIERGIRPRLVVVQGPTSFRASLAEEALNGAINGFARAVVAERLRAAGLPPGTAQPIELKGVNVATREERSGNLLGQFLPFLVVAQVVALMTGIAIDISAGEKERRTIEALVVTPLSRREIVFGKWLLTVAIGSFGALVTIATALVTFQRTTSSLVGDGVGLLPAGAIGSIVVAGIATALLIGSVQLLIGFFARSIQQAAAMASPLFLIVFVPLLLLEGQSGTTIGPAMYAIPALGPTMLARFGLDGSAVASALPITVVTTLVYSTLVLLLTDRLFRSERALLRV